MRNPVITNFLLFIGFLVVGYSISTRFYTSDYSGLSNTYYIRLTRSSNSIQTLDNGQRNILLIGVNSIDITKARLESIWLLTSLPQTSTIQMFPIYPSKNSTVSDFEKHLLLSFKLENNSGKPVLDQDLINFLKENNFWWSGYIVFDHVAGDQFLNLLSEGDQNGYTNLKHQINEDYSEATFSHQKAFELQLSLMRTVCHGLSGLSPNSDLEKVFLFSPAHLFSDMDLNEVFLEWSNEIQDNKIPKCLFPTQVNTQVNN
jgi:hypothetical protein